MEIAIDFFVCSSWGESFFIFIQMLILIFLMFLFNQHLTYLLLFLPVFTLALWILTSDLVTMNVLSTLQASVIPMMLLSRVGRVAEWCWSKDQRDFVFFVKFFTLIGKNSMV